MLCRIYYLYPDGTKEMDNEFGIIDFDYCNIRQYRKIYTKFALKNEKFRFQNIRLLIEPVRKDDVF